MFEKNIGRPSQPHLLFWAKRMQGLVEGCTRFDFSDDQK